MKRNRLVIAALSSLLAFGAVAPSAMAAGDPPGPPGDDGYGRGWRDDDGRDAGDRRYDNRRHDDRRRDYRQGDGRGRGYGYGNPPPPGPPGPPVPVVPVPPPVAPPPPPPPPYYVGRRYGGPIYVVDDYYRYDVRRPPRGYHWVRDDAGNLIMVAIATGIIADIVLHH